MVRKMQILIFASRPFAKEDVSGIFTAKVSSQSLFEGAPEEHGRPECLSLSTHRDSDGDSGEGRSNIG
jgi:hypothetical protein